MANPKKRILVIDDEAPFTRMLKLSLEQTESYEVQVENSAVRALASALEFRPDLVLMDVMMPGMDGGTLAARFRAHSRLHEVPIIFLSAAVRREEVSARNGKIGGFPFLAKPVELEQVTACLRQHLGAAKQERTGAGKTATARQDRHPHGLGS